MNRSGKNILIVIQARRGSSRLPDKVLLPLAGKPLLVRMAERVAAAKTPKEIVIATTLEKEDDIIVDLCNEHGLKYFRGHLSDLLDRHYKAGVQSGADVVVKIPSDCPLVCPDVIDSVLGFFLENESEYDFVSNLHPASHPDGNDVEVIPMKTLETAWREAGKEFEREHTTPFIWERPERFRIGNVEWETGLDLSKSHRFTIDYIEDYEFIKRIYEELYEVKNNFKLCDIMMLLDRKPEIKKINEMHAGKYWYRDHMDELKTV
ncbi:MAG: glycosyltransferase family protein [Ignavibacteria bacterium]